MTHEILNYFIQLFKLKFDPKDIDLILLQPVEFQSSCNPLTKTLVFFHGVEVFFEMFCKFFHPRVVLFIGPSKDRKKSN